MRTEGRVLPVGLAVLTLAAAMPGSGRADDLPALKAKGQVRVLAMRALPTDEFLPEGGERPGFDLEIIEGFARLHKLKVVMIRLDGWDRLAPALLEGQGDLVAGRYTATEERRKRIAFTREVFPTRNVAVTLKPHRPVLTLDALRAERVSTVKGSSMEEALLKAGIPRERLDDSVPPGQLRDAVLAGKAAVAVLGIEDAIAGHREDARLELGVFVGPTASLAFGVRKEDKALLAALDDYIDNLRRTPSWSRLVVKYFGEAAPDVLRRAKAE